MAESTRLGRLVATAAFISLGAYAHAQEFCVVCAGPEASYRCLIGGNVHQATRIARGQFLCITELARSGGHTSCSASRAQATPCAGETRTVMFPPGELDNAPSQPAATEVDPLPAPPPPADAMSPPPLGPGEDAQHATNEEHNAPDPASSNPLENLSKKTGKAVQDTGEAVGGAVKKTWDCVTSLFGDC